MESLHVGQLDMQAGSQGHLTSPGRLHVVSRSQGIASEIAPCSGLVSCERGCALQRVHGLVAFAYSIQTLPSDEEHMRVIRPGSAALIEKPK